ncbi:unnamed protein product, partial [Symbiodinium sp. KB8]
AMSISWLMGYALLVCLQFAVDTTRRVGAPHHVPVALLLPGPQLRWFARCSVASSAACSLGALPPYMPLRPKLRPFGGPPSRLCHLRCPSRALPLEHALARICREAGARVGRNVRVADMNIDVPVSDARRIEVACSGTELSPRPLKRDGSPQPAADAQPGVSLDTHIRRSSTPAAAALSSSAWKQAHSGRQLQAMRGRSSRVKGDTMMPCQGELGPLPKEEREWEPQITQQKTRAKRPAWDRQTDGPTGGGKGVLGCDSEKSGTTRNPGGDRGRSGGGWGSIIRDSIAGSSGGDTGVSSVRLVTANRSGRDKGDVLTKCALPPSVCKETPGLQQWPGLQYLHILLAVATVVGKPVHLDALAYAGQEELPEEEEEEDPYPPGPSPNINHPHYRPPDMEVVPGLTDRRFVGVMYLWFEDKGFGFIECPDITKKFGQDALEEDESKSLLKAGAGGSAKVVKLDEPISLYWFLHRTQRKNFKRGQYVSFSVYLNYRGKPQATELRKAEKPKPDEKTET